MPPTHEVFQPRKGPGLIKAWTRGLPIEDAARAQLDNIAGLPFIHRWLAVMPDVHLGKGATVGSVIPTHRAIIPAAVWVDLGCGMMAARTTLTASDLPDDLRGLRIAIEAAVPHGRTANGGRGDRGAWGSPPDAVSAAWKGLEAEHGALCERHPALRNANTVNHLGTLGGGNHFIEVCID